MQKKPKLLLISFYLPLIGLAALTADARAGVQFNSWSLRTASFNHCVTGCGVCGACCQIDATVVPLPYINAQHTQTPAFCDGNPALSTADTGYNFNAAGDDLSFSFVHSRPGYRDGDAESTGTLVFHVPTCIQITLSANYTLNGPGTAVLQATLHDGTTNADVVSESQSSTGNQTLSFSHSCVLVSGRQYTLTYALAIFSFFDDAGANANGFMDLSLGAVVGGPTVSNPSGQTVCPHTTATFTVNANGTAPISYQWTKDGVDISGANSNSLVISNATTSDNGSYAVRVTDPCGTATSASATLTVEDDQAPTINSCDASTNIAADANCQALIPDLTGHVSASDNCGAVSITQSPAPNSAAVLGPNPLTITVMDGAGHTAQCNGTVTVVDATPPMISLPTASSIVDTNCSGGEPAPAATAADNCDGTVPVNASPSVLPAGQTTTVTYSASDSSSNSSQAMKSITVLYGANIIANVQQAIVGTGAHPQTITTPMGGATVKAFDSSAGSCARQQGSRQLTHNDYPLILANCTPVGSGTTDGSGYATINLPPGSYLVLSQIDANTILAGQTSMTCGQAPQVNLRVIVNANNGNSKPGKVTVLTGTRLLVIEPEYVIWDGTVQLYPFTFESEGDWGVIATVTPPAGFVADYPSLSTDVNNAVDGLQFTITELGSDLVPTQTLFNIRHKGRDIAVHSSVGIKMTREYAISRGFNPDELRKKGILFEPKPARSVISTIRN